MTANDAQARRHRWYHCTSDRFLVWLLAAVEGVLLLSERYRWFPFNERKGYTVLIAVAVVCAALLLMMLWFAGSLVLRRRFQFCLSSLFVLVVVVALPCNSLAVKMQEAREQREKVESWRKSGFLVKYRSPEAHPILEKLLGVDFFRDVYPPAVSAFPTSPMPTWKTSRSLAMSTCCSCATRESRAPA